MLAVELAVLAASDTETTPGHKVPAVRHVSLAEGRELEYDRPGVLLAASSTSTDTTQPACVYVVRYRFDR